MTTYDYSKYDASKESYPTLPPGWYTMVIDVATEKISKKGHLMMEIDCHAEMEEGKIVNENISVRHWVTFIPPTEAGAGIAVHFLKCIGLPESGELNPFQWEGRHFKGKVILDTYNGKTRNKIEEISPLPGGAVAGSKPDKKEEEEIPF